MKPANKLLKLFEEVPGKYSHIDFVPPKGAKEAAEKAIEWKKKYKDEVKGGTIIGWKRASQLASGMKMSPKTIRRMHSFFSRHKNNKKVDAEDKERPWKDNGYVAWLIWGGDAGATWSAKVVNQMNKADEE